MSARRIWLSAVASGRTPSSIVDSDNYGLQGPDLYLGAFRLGENSRLSRAGLGGEFAHGRLRHPRGGLSVHVRQDADRRAAIDVAGHAAAADVLDEMRQERHVAVPGDPRP